MIAKGNVITADSRKTVWCLMLALVLCGICGGCSSMQWLGYVFLGQSHREVSAQYAGLVDSRIVLIVMSTPAIDFDYPYARDELTRLGAMAIASQVEGAEFVRSEEILAFQNERIDFVQMPVADIGQAFGADRVVYLEMIQYAMTEANSANLLRGRIVCEVRVYDLTTHDDYGGQIPCYKGNLAVTVPEAAPVPMNPEARGRIELATLRQFGSELAGLFYDHDEPVR
jgi:hypothetical protein